MTAKCETCRYWMNAPNMTVALSEAEFVSARLCANLQSWNYKIWALATGGCSHHEASTKQSPHRGTTE